MEFGYPSIKRGVDLVLASALFIALIPVLGILFFLVRVKLGAPAIFRQSRGGFRGRIFKIYKFRSMTDARDPGGEMLPDEARLTNFGKWLRATSLDELPALLNVIKGDMSLIGPRPLLADYLSLYNSYQKRRHEVRPGITGWAQVNGRNELDWEARFDLDIWYVDHCSFGLDLRILALTGYRILTRDGVSKEGHVTMPRFLGSKN